MHAVPTSAAADETDAEIGRLGVFLPKPVSVGMAWRLLAEYR